MSELQISVVVAAKDPTWEYLNLCISSFAALRNAHRLQMVLVVSGVQPALSEPLTRSFGEYLVLDVAANGVYSAYNAGIDAAIGRYVLFFGIDDVALPGMDAVIERLTGHGDDYQLFAAACFMQGVGLSVPSSWRASLILGNWCHQGIFYSREYLSRNRFDPKYRAQADHKMNIDIVSNRALRFGTSKEVVAYFSAGGESSLRPDLEFRRDFPSIVTRSYGWYYGVLVKLKQLLLDTVMGPPERRFRSRNRH